MADNEMPRLEVDEQLSIEGFQPKRNFAVVSYVEFFGVR
jgi:hypothetical protein